MFSNVLKCNFLGLIADPISDARISLINGGTPITTVNKDSYSYPPASHSHGGATGSFASANGKTVNVTNGIITSIA
jgi:hypothetical protein